MGTPTKTAGHTLVNGINVDGLFALIDDVKREPAKGKTNWHVVTIWQGQTRSRAEIERYELAGERGPCRFSIDITSLANSEAGYEKLSYQGERHTRAVRRDPQRGDGDLAQFLQSIPGCGS